MKDLGLVFVTIFLLVLLLLLCFCLIRNIKPSRMQRILKHALYGSGASGGSMGADGGYDCEEDTHILARSDILDVSKENSYARTPTSKRTSFNSTGGGANDFVTKLSCSDETRHCTSPSTPFAQPAAAGPQEPLAPKLSTTNPFHQSNTGISLPPPPPSPRSNQRTKSTTPENDPTMLKTGLSAPPESDPRRRRSDPVTHEPLSDANGSTNGTRRSSGTGPGYAGPTSFVELSPPDKSNSLSSPRQRGSLETDSIASDDLSFLEISARERRLSGSSEDNFSEFDDSNPARLTRAMSSESVESICSAYELVNNDNYSGQLEVRLFYDRFEKCLNIWVVQAYELKALGLEPEVWVVVFLLPHAKPIWRTNLVRGTANPQFHEQYQQKIREVNVRKFALLCQVYSRFNDVISVVGQSKVRLKDVELSEPNTLWLSLIPSANVEPTDVKVGEILFSLQFVPVVERLTVVISKVRGIRRADGSLPKGIFAKVYLVQSSRKITKKKTSLAALQEDGSASINESMIFSLSQSYLNKVYLRLSLVEPIPESGDYLTLGHVTLGSRCSDKAFGHWNQVVRAPNKPVVMWHPVVPKRAN